MMIVYNMYTFHYVILLYWGQDICAALYLKGWVWLGLVLILPSFFIASLHPERVYRPFHVSLI